MILKKSIYSSHFFNTLLNICFNKPLLSILPHQQITIHFKNKCRHARLHRLEHRNSFPRFMLSSDSIPPIERLEATGGALQFIQSSCSAHGRRKSARMRIGGLLSPCSGEGRTGRVSTRLLSVVRTRDNLRQGSSFQRSVMSVQEDPVQREIHQDWANREYIEVITSSIKKIADFLNSFGRSRAGAECTASSARPSLWRECIAAWQPALGLEGFPVLWVAALTRRSPGSSLCLPADMSCRSRLATLNEKLTALERRIEYIEARVRRLQVLPHFYLSLPPGRVASRKPPSFLPSVDHSLPTQRSLDPLKRIQGESFCRLHHCRRSIGCKKAFCSFKK